MGNNELCAHFTDWVWHVSAFKDFRVLWIGQIYTNKQENESSGLLTILAS